MLQGNKIKIIIVSFIAILIFGIIFIFYYTDNISGTQVEEEQIAYEIEDNNENLNTEEIEQIIYKVDLKGAVVNPGVYEVKSDSRVIDVINLAGGLTKNADTSDINLSKVIKDEMVIIVSTKEEILANKNSKTSDNTQVNNSATISQSSTITSTITPSENNNIVDNNSTLININTATLEELQTLNGIGESKAQAIIEYRNNNGLFTSIEDIKNVSGIGDSAFEKIKNNITV